jgi:hypothetical protein
VSWGIEPLGDLPAAFFLQNVLQLHEQRLVILCIDSFALWKIINEEDAFLITKNRRDNFTSGFLRLEFFGWYNQVSSMVINHNRKSFGSRRAEKIPTVVQMTGTTDVLHPCSGILGPTSQRASSCQILHELWT